VLTGVARRLCWFIAEESSATRIIKAIKGES
jgi:hypothetical protein